MKALNLIKIKQKIMQSSEEIGPGNSIGKIYVHFIPSLLFLARVFECLSDPLSNYSCKLIWEIVRNC